MAVGYLTEAAAVLVEPFHAMDHVIEVDFRFFHFLLQGSPVACTGDQESGEKYECGGQDRRPRDIGSRQGLIAKG